MQHEQPASIRPIVITSDGAAPREMHRVNDEACAAFERIASDHMIYKSNGWLVQIMDDDVRRVPVFHLRHLLSVAADFRRRLSTGELVPAHVPAWCARAIHARGDWSIEVYRFGCRRGPSSNVRLLRGSAA